MIVAMIATLAPALVILLGIGAMISAAETSMTAASRGRMHQLERDGDRAAQRVNRLISDQENMIGAILLSFAGVICLLQPSVGKDQLTGGMIGLISGMFTALAVVYTGVAYFFWRSQFAPEDPAATAAPAQFEA